MNESTAEIVIFCAAAIAFCFVLLWALLAGEHAKAWRREAEEYRELYEENECELASLQQKLTAARAVLCEDDDDSDEDDDE